MLALFLAGPAAAMEVKVVDDQIIMSGRIDAGDLRSSIQAGDFIRRQGWNTAVSGYCFSGCALMFLGGRERRFTDDRLSAWHTAEARRWIRRGTDGKVSDAMLDRFEALAKTDFIHFFDPNQLSRKGQVSIFVCPIVKEGGRKCEPIAGTDVYLEGIANSETLIRSNDRR